MMEKQNVVTPRRTPKPERKQEDWVKSASAEFKPPKADKPCVKTT